MADKKIQLKIITPEGNKVDEAVDMIVMRCTTGDIGILYRHEPRTAILNYGLLRMINEGVERKIAVYGGTATIQNNVLTVLTSGADWPDEIDLTKAQADRDHAERRLREKADDLEIEVDQVLLRRALVQIEAGLSTADDEEN